MRLATSVSIVTFVLPHTVNTHHLFFSVDNTLQLSDNSDVIALGVIPSFSPPRSFSVPLNLLTYNCMHMADDNNDASVSNERALFLEAIGDQFSIIGVQEARSAPGRKFVPGYVLFSSGHLNHSIGVETWISIDQAFDLVDSVSGKISICFVEPEQVCFIYGDPRFLIISFGLFGVAVFVADVHALHQTHGTRECIAFWRRICDLINKYVPREKHEISRITI